MCQRRFSARKVSFSTRETKHSLVNVAKQPRGKGNKAAYLLNGASNVAEPDVYSCFFDSGVRRLLHGCQQGLKFGIERNSEGRINQVPLHMNSEVHLAHVIFPQDRIIAVVRSIVRCAVVQAHSCGEGQTLLNSIF